MHLSDIALMFVIATLSIANAERYNEEKFRNSGNGQGQRDDYIYNERNEYVSRKTHRWYFMTDKCAMANNCGQFRECCIQNCVDFDVEHYIEMSCRLDLIGKFDMNILECYCTNTYDYITQRQLSVSRKTHRWYFMTDKCAMANNCGQFRECCIQNCVDFDVEHYIEMSCRLDLIGKFDMNILECYCTNTASHRGIASLQIMALATMTSLIIGRLY